MGSATTSSVGGSCRRSGVPASRHDRVALPLELRPSAARTPAGRPRTRPGGPAGGHGGDRLDPPGTGRRCLGREVHGPSSPAGAWARARAMARALRIGQQVTVSTVMAAKLHQKGAVSP
jgi:hypothetical protein